MKKTKNIFKDFMSQIDMMNTINGGTTLTSVAVDKNEDHIQIKLSSPGVSSESYNILLQGNQLIIYSVLKKENDFLTTEEAEEKPEVPRFSKSFDLPPFVDIDNIDAVFEENVLKVVLPFKSMDETIKKIDIRHF